MYIAGAVLISFVVAFFLPLPLAFVFGATVGIAGGILQAEYGNNV